jgi:lipid-A-disaccharide synthase
VMISCGEASGDLYAGALAAELRTQSPAVDVFGLGGPRLEAAGGRLIGDFSGFSVVGLTAPLRVIPHSIAMLRRLAAAARAERPDVFVPIDFSGFNFRLMAVMRRLGVPVAYYVSPQLWAWRPWRINAMKVHVDRVLVLFPFEQDLYRNAGVPVEFVGHPLVDLARASQPREPFLRSLGLQPDAPTVALLPGSRRSELQRIAPTLAEAVPLIRARVPGVQFVVACAPGVPDDLFGPFGGLVKDGSDVPSERGSPPVLVHGRTDDVIAASDIVITASGTATVQCALHERPMVVVYRVSPLEYRIGKRFVKVDMYAMPNLIAGRRIVPELIQDDFTPHAVASHAVALLTDDALRARTREGLRGVRAQLGAPGASARAAAAVLDVARGARRA